MLREKSTGFMALEFKALPDQVVTQAFFITANSS